MTNIEGIKALHRTVNLSCRKRPDNEWIEDIKKDLEKELKSLDKSWKNNSQVKFHVVLTVDYER